MNFIDSIGAMFQYVILHLAGPGLFDVGKILEKWSNS